jgi:hypothetical protein
MWRYTVAAIIYVVDGTSLTSDLAPGGITLRN